MAKTVDPAFQAAPFLGQSSHDAVAFASRQKYQKFEIQRQKREEEARNTAKGLQDLMDEVKGWEDQEGFKEIMADQDRILNGYLELSRKGMNLVSPKETNEILAYKAIQEAHQKLKMKVDAWNQQKGIYDMYSKAIEQDSAKPEDEQKIDREATLANIQRVLGSKKILERGSDLQNLVVTKPDYGDVVKYVTDRKDFFEQPVMTQTIVENPETGQREIQQVQKLTPEQEKENQKRLGVMYEGMDQKYKNTVRRQRERDTNPAMNIMPDKDYFIASFDPTYKQRFMERPASTGQGGMSINFGGSQVKVSPGELHTNDQIYGGRNYNERYDFATNKPIKVPTSGGVMQDHEINTKNPNDDGWSPITGGGDVEAELRFYDPKTDMLIFRTTATAKTPWVDNNITIAVPRKNVPEADKLPVGLPNGKKGSLKDVVPSVVPKKKIGVSDGFWNKPAGEVYLPGSKKAKGSYDGL